jgi:hypothetical protein
LDAIFGIFTVVSHHTSFAWRAFQMSDFNPFEAPKENSSALGSTPHELRGVLIKFRQQMTALGGVWTFFGVLTLVAVIALTVLSDQIPDPELQSFLFVAILGGMSALWLTVGIASDKRTFAFCSAETHSFLG